jgi:DNA polymerase-3 subunit alpha
MTASGFVHLHLHTQYSLLDGAIRLHELFPRLGEIGQDAVAMTDHGVMFGAIDFYGRAEKAGIRPIIGCELYVSPGPMTDRKQRGAYHLVLLARDEEGYANLVYLVSKAHLEGFFYSPRIDKPLLGAHSRGLIGMSACLAGEVTRVLADRGEEAAERVACEYRELFEPDGWFLEVQQTGVPGQEETNRVLRRISNRTGIPLVATNDAHYLYREDGAAHDILMRIQEGKTIRDEVKLSHSKLALYLRSAAEMREALPDYPDAIERTVDIADRCRVTLKLGEAMMPGYAVPEGESVDSYFRSLAAEGLVRRLEQLRGEGTHPDEAKYRTRLEYELGIICKKGYAGYYLIVHDFIRHAKSEGIPVGPGRGSGAGSLVAYSLRITDLDPIRFGLLFERFLNPDRPSTPDFDVDFCKNRRDEVIRYMVGKYGADRVGQIATFHQMKSRTAVKDVGRVLEIPFAERDRLSKLIPAPAQGETGSVLAALDVEPRLKAEYEGREEVRRWIDLAARLEGLHRHAGQHAAGIVIGHRPLWEIVPVFRSKDGALVCQYDMNAAERVGLVKFDFLGLKNLTSIAHAVRLIRRKPGFEGFDVEHLPLDDKPTFDLLASGQTLGVFQVESRGFRELLRRLRPDRIEDIVAAVAIFRPGPLGVGADETYIRRKHGLEPITCLHPIVEKVCSETYGVLLYQEQVMQIAVDLAGYTLGRADALRKAMGKKRLDEMEKNREPFIDGARAREVDPGIATRIFEEIGHFAEYAFNKSHSAAYALITYQTAYLKAHHPVEFLTALLTCDRDDSDRVVRFISEARSLGIEVLGPDVNESADDFEVIGAGASGGGSRIRFGLGAVKGLGSAAVEAILEARGEGPFADLFDFCARVDARRVNRAVLEGLVKAGAFDSTARTGGVHRAALLATLDAAVEYGRGRQRDRETGQQGLFDLGAEAGSGAGAVATEPVRYIDAPPWDEDEQLRHERRTIGAYLSGHPLHRYAGDLDRWAGTLAADVEEHPVGTVLTVGGVVENLVEKLNKKTGRRTAVFSLEDLAGAVETFVPPQPLERFEAALLAGRPVLCTGRVESAVFRSDGQGDDGEDERKRFVLVEVATFEEVRRERTREVHLRIGAPAAAADALDRLRRLLDEHRGSCAAYLHLAVPSRGEVVVALPDRWRVEPSDGLIAEIGRAFGPRCLFFA